MFGYVTPLKMELKVKDYEKFKAYYCGLCHYIKKNFGNIPRLSLSYDMTFLAILLDSLQEGNISYDQFFCLVHPTKKKLKIINSDALNYTSYLNIILFYYKLIDDVNDDKSLKAKLASIFLNKGSNKFKHHFSNIHNKIVTELDNLNKMEASDCKNIDEIAHPFAELTGFLLKSYPLSLLNDSLELREKLYTLGYNLGKWIYIIDAVDDLQKDLKDNKYNPINAAMNPNNYEFEKLFETQKERIEFLLLSCSSQCYNSFKELNFVKDSAIVENILLFGIMNKNDVILNKYNLTDNNNCSRRSVN